MITSNLINTRIDISIFCQEYSGLSSIVLLMNGRQIIYNRYNNRFCLEETSDICYKRINTLLSFKNLLNDNPGFIKVYDIKKDGYYIGIKCENYKIVSNNAPVLFYVFARKYYYKVFSFREYNFEKKSLTFFRVDSKYYSNYVFSPITYYPKSEIEQI